jgi:hypothetical protein
MVNCKSNWLTLVVFILFGAALPTASIIMERQQSAPPCPQPTVDATFNIDLNQQGTEISPYIYGTNLYKDTDTFPAYSTLGRIGGNLWTMYNWENNASNSGNDWQHFNTGFLGGGDIPANAVKLRMDKIRANKAAALITVPIGDAVAADKINTDVTKTPDYQATRFRKVGLSGQCTTVPRGEATVYSDDLLCNVVARYGYNDIFYALDNEPDLWHINHSETYSKAQTYAGYTDRFIKYAKATKNIVGHGLVFGPVLSGFYGLQSLGGAPDANARFFADYFLVEMAKAERTTGKRLLDVFDFHWYPEHHGSNNVQIFTDNNDPETVAARVQAPRSLYDPNFMENSWITNDVLKKPINLLQMMKDKINANYPGTRLAITEYYYGGGDHISGAIAEADVLGSFARAGLFAASLWHLGNGDDRFITAAFEIYRDFGPTIIRVTNGDPQNYSVIAGKRKIIILNKSTAQKVVAINGITAKKAWRIEGTSPEKKAIAVPDLSKVQLTPMSITVLDL